MTIESLLESLSITQKKASNALLKKDLNSAHINLKQTAIKLFENTGKNKAFDLETAVRLFLIFFQAPYYLQNKQGEYIYRYEAIPGQLGNACHFQLGLSTRDASGYHPSPKAVKECAGAAHKLLEDFAPNIIIQTKEQRRKKVAEIFPRDAIIFT